MLGGWGWCSSEMLAELQEHRQRCRSLWPPLPSGLGPHVLGEEEEGGLQWRSRGWGGGDGEESGTEGSSNLRAVCSNPKNKGNWVIVPLIHLITGQSNSLVR